VFVLSFCFNVMFACVRRVRVVVLRICGAVVLRVCVRACVCACVRAYVRACAHVRAYVRACVRTSAHKTQITNESTMFIGKLMNITKNDIHL